MNYFSGVIVVEGKNDASFLSSFISCEYVALNGWELSKKTIDYLSNIKNRKIVVLTDSDKAGKEIRKKLFEIGIVADSVEVDIDKCNKHNKHGVAECEKDEIIRVLQKYFENKIEYPVISNKFLNKYHILENKQIQQLILDYFHLGECNSKTMIKRLQYNQINENDIKIVIENYYDNR